MEVRSLRTLKIFGNPSVTIYFFFNEVNGRLLEKKEQNVQRGPIKNRPTGVVYLKVL